MPINNKIGTKVRISIKIGPFSRYCLNLGDLDSFHEMIFGKKSAFKIKANWVNFINIEYKNW